MSIKTVSAGQDLQAALNAALPGDVLNLEAGAVFTGTVSLAKQCGTNHITLQSSRLAELPEGKRVTPADSAKMPKIVSPGSGSPALQTGGAASGYKLLGIEILPADENTFSYQLVTLGDDYPNAAKELSAVAGHIVIDRCYIHAWPNQSLKRGIMLNSSHTEIINSHISGFKAVGQEAQCILGYNGPGPFKIINNYLEGAGENVMFGGADPRIPNLVPSDIEIRRNHFFKPLAWRGVWQVKNTFELKNARRVHVEGNIFENNWVDAQSGFMVQLTPRNQEGSAPWSTVEDVLIVNNHFKNTASGINFMGQDAINGPTVKSQQMKNVIVRNNLFENVGAAWSNPGLGNAVFQSGSGAALLGVLNLTIERNTVKSSNATNFYLYGAPTSGLVYRGNIGGVGGFSGSEMSPGFTSLDRYAPGYVITDNDIINVFRTDLHPPGNDYPTSEAGVKPSATRGVNMIALEAALGGTAATTPTPPPPPPPPPTLPPPTTPPPTPAPAPTLRKVPWPGTEGAQNQVIEQQWNSLEGRYRFKRNLSGKFAEFEKVS